MNGLEPREPGMPAGPRHGRRLRPVVGQPRPGLSSWMARSVTRTAARNRLDAELRAIAVDLLGRCQPGELPDDCAEWLAATVEAAVTGVCESSRGSLADALDARLDAAPVWVARRIREAEVRHDAGNV